MTAKFSCFVLLLTLTCCAFGQDTSRQNLFLTGIYLENLHVTIPWSADYKKIVSVGSPIIDTPHRNMVRFKWDSVKILNDVIISLTFYLSKQQIRKEKPLQVLNFSGVIDTSDIRRIKRYLADYTKQGDNYNDNKYPTSGGWKINGAMMKIGIHKWRHQPVIGLCDIQKVLPKQNGM